MNGVSGRNAQGKRIWPGPTIYGPLCRHVWDFRTGALLWEYTQKAVNFTQVYFSEMQRVCRGWYEPSAAIIKGDYASCNAITYRLEWITETVHHKCAGKLTEQHVNMNLQQVIQNSPSPSGKNSHQILCAEIWRIDALRIPYRSWGAKIFLWSPIKSTKAEQQNTSCHKRSAECGKLTHRTVHIQKLRITHAEFRSPTFPSHNFQAISFWCFSSRFPSGLSNGSQKTRQYHSVCVVTRFHELLRNHNHNKDNGMHPHSPSICWICQSCVNLPRRDLTPAFLLYKHWEKMRLCSAHILCWVLFFAAMGDLSLCDVPLSNQYQQTPLWFLGNLHKHFWMFHAIWVLFRFCLNFFAVPSASDCAYCAHLLPCS